MAGEMHVTLDRGQSRRQTDQRMCRSSWTDTIHLEHVAFRPPKQDGLLGTGTLGEEGERVKVRPQIPPKKRLERPWTAARTMEVLRRCPLAIAQRLVHCAIIAVSTAVLDRVTRTMSVALLLRNNPKRKKSNFRSPAPLPCSSLLGYNLRVQLHLPPLDLAWKPVIHHASSWV